VEGAQTPLEIVQDNIFCPIEKSDAAVDGLLAAKKEALPDSTDHEPTPVKGVLAFSVVVPAHKV